MVERYQNGTDQGEPLEFTAILAALGRAGDDDNPDAAAQQPVTKLGVSPVWV